MLKYAITVCWITIADNEIKALYGFDLVKINALITEKKHANVF